MIRRAALIALLVAGGRSGVGAQPIVLRDPGPGTGPQILRSALTVPYVLLPPGAETAVLRRDTAYATTVVVLGRDATVASRVHGDVIVVDGDLFIYPGAMIDGRAIAYGGAVYNSLLAVTGERLSFRDFTYAITPITSGYALDYRPLRADVSPALTWPGVFGLALPLYDRSNGLSLGFGPLVSLDTGHLEVRPRLTYRSQLGRVDPRVAARFRLDRRTSLDLFAGRSSFSNESWIWSDLLNSASVLGTGDDTRNYYRADRADVTLHRVWETPTLTIEPFAGGRGERAWSVRPDSGATGGPWSLFGRHSLKGILRPNPQIDAGTITSLIGGARLRWESRGIRAAVVADEEIALRSPTPRRFAQTTLDGTVTFPTFRTQRYRFDTHIVLTAGRAPSQRWAYLGGAGTIPLLHLLEQGGDQLLFLDSRYEVPIDRITLPLAGSPTLALRHLLGGAGVGRLPGLEQRVGLRVTLSVARVEFLVDPASRRAQIGVGVAFAR